MELKKMEKVNRILQLCFEINGFEKRQKEYTGDKPTIIMYFYGHTAGLEIRIYEKGWICYEEKDKYAQADVEISIELYRPFHEIKEYMDECITYLESLKEVSQYECLQQAI